MLTDLKAALRQLTKAPGFSTIVVVTLALGIGANTAIFSFFNAILLRPLPFTEPGRTVMVKDRARDFTEIVGERVGILSEDFRELQGQVRSFSDMATLTMDAATLTGRERADLVFGAIVTHNFFTVLGSSAKLGRVFSVEDQGNRAGRLAVLSHSYWQNSLGGDPAILGQAVTLNDVSFTVVGVMPPDFDYPRFIKFWVTPADVVPEPVIGSAPGVERGQDRAGRGNSLRSIIARLRPGVPIGVAEQELRSLAQRLPNPNAIERSIHLVTLRDQTVGETRPALLTLLGCVGIVLLIACVNVANLMLSRATTRQQEVAVRLALGSSWWRIGRQLLTESLVLAVLGGFLGVLLSRAALSLMVRAAPEQIPLLAAVEINLPVLGFAAGVSALTGMACGLAPIFGTLKTDLASATKSATRGNSGSPASRRLRTALVTGEVAIALVLLVVAGLLLRSFWRMQAFSWGFRPEQVVTARIGFTAERYRTPEAQLVLYRALLDQLRVQPGFTSAATSFDRIGATWIRSRFVPEGHVYAQPHEAPEARYRIVSPGYFDTLGIALLQGRDFTGADHENSAPVAIVDADLARRFYPDGQAVGKRLRLAQRGQPWVEIVGVAANVKSDGPNPTPRSDLYLPFTQFTMDSLFVQVRTPLSVADATAGIERVVRSIDADLPVVMVTSMQQVVSAASDTRRFPLGLIGGFAGLALLLAAIGIYAVTSYGVAQRQRELGLRMALGAPPRAVVGLVLRQSFQPVGAGVAIGLVAGVVAALAMRTMLFGIEALDVQTFVLVPLPLVGIALVACWIPARQAARVDPMIALRSD